MSPAEPLPSPTPSARAWWGNNRSSDVIAISFTGWLIGQGKSWRLSAAVARRASGGTEEALVLPIEVGSVVGPHTICRTGRVEVFAQHQTAGFLESQPLLELQVAHRCDGLQVPYNARMSHF